MTPNIFFKNYRNQLNHALDTVNTAALSKAIDAITECVNRGSTIFVCGNGGSAAIADHLTCDCLKGIRTDTEDFFPRVVSLASNGPLITAIANDIGYDRVFSYQLESLAKPGDILITISSSGNSPNIVEAIKAAHSIGMISVAMCGFSGGASLHTDICLHVKNDNYGIVEDCHQSLMHMISQFLRITKSKPGAELKL